MSAAQAVREEALARFMEAVEKVEVEARAAEARAAEARAAAAEARAAEAREAEKRLGSLLAELSLGRNGPVITKKTAVSALFRNMYISPKQNPAAAPAPRP